MKYKFTKPFYRIFALALIALLAIPFAAFADELVVDGDGLAPVNINNSTLNLGNVDFGQTTSGSVVFAMKHTDGGANVFKNSTTPSVTAGTPNGSSGVSTFVGVGQGEAGIDIPSNWSTLNQNSSITTIDTATAIVVVSAVGATCGAKQATIVYTATGVNNVNGNALTRQATLTVNWTVMNCQVATTLTVDAASSTYGGSATLSATISPAVQGKSVSFKLDGVSVGSASTNASGVATLPSVSLGSRNAGTYPISASFPGDTTHGPSSGSSTITIAKAKATVNVSGYTGAYDGNPHGATGSATGVNGENLSGLLSFGSSFTNAPGGTANWSFAGDPNYSSDSGSVNISIGKINATVNVTGYDGDYDSHAHGATGTAAGIDSVDLSSYLALGASFTDVPGGDANWTFAGDNNYNSDSGSVSIAIGPAAAIIHIDGFSGTYDGNAHGATGTATGVNGEDLSGQLSLGNKYTNAGEYTVDWSFAGNINYEAASGQVAIKIDRADAVITVDGYTGTYDGTAHGATGTATGVNGEDLSSYLDLGASFTDVPGGDANWTFADNANYSPASGSVNVAIAPAAASISVNGYSGTYDGTAHGATGTATGVNDEDLSGLLNLGASFTDVPGGTANWSFAGNTNYNTASGTAAIVIGKAAASTVVNGFNGTYDGDAHGATGSAMGVDGADLSASLNLGATFTNVPGGLAHWTFSGGTNYSDGAGNVAINISKADATVTVTGYTGTYDAAAHAASGSVIGVDAGGVALGSSLDLGASFTNVPGGTAHWTFTGGTNYNDKSGDAPININKASANVLVNGYTGTYDAAAHGATLGHATGVGGVDLSSGINLGASFTNAPGGTAHWTFTGGTNYNDQSGDAPININKATPVISWSNPAAIMYSTALSSAQLNATADVAGAFVYSPAAGTILTVGTQTLTVNFTPSDTTNYNNSSAQVQITINPWRFSGFYQPVDMPGTAATPVYNTVKSGSTVPFKFELFQGNTELIATSNINSLKYAVVPCGGTVEDAIELTATGGTVLRYDSSGIGQFVYNWQTPSGKAGSCYKVTIGSLDGSSLSAYFKLK